MKTLAFALALLLIGFTLLASDDVRSGVWTGDARDGKLHLSLMDNREKRQHGWGNMMGFALPQSRFQGLTLTEKTTFRLEAAAGTVEFRGYFHGTEGAGHFDFTPKPEFVKQMSALGYSGFKPHMMLVFAIHDFSPEVIRDLRAMGYEPSSSQIEEIAIFRITAGALKEYERLGLGRVSLREAVNLRVGRVDAEWISGMRDLGYTSMRAGEAADAAILGVRPEWVRDMQAAGLKKLTLGQLRDLKVGNITPAAMRGFAQAGYPDLTPSQLSDFGIHRVTPEYIAELRKLGYDNLRPSQLVEMRIFNVTPAFIREMNQMGVKDLHKMVELKQTGAADILLKRRK